MKTGKYNLADWQAILCFVLAFYAALFSDNEEASYVLIVVAVLWEVVSQLININKKLQIERKDHE